MQFLIRSIAEHAGFNDALQRLQPRFNALFQELQELPCSEQFSAVCFEWADQGDAEYAFQQIDTTLTIRLGFDAAFEFKMTLDDILLGELVRTLQKGIGRSPLPAVDQQLLLPAIQQWYYPVE